jgi:hypothetical protein
MEPFSPDAWKYFFCWCLLWIILLILPPGSTAINTAYRLNFIHGVLSSVIAYAALEDLLPASLATMCTISYFVIDFSNILVNDFIFKVPSYQSPQNRRVEYFHHLFCLFVGISCETFHMDVCTFQKQPFLYLMFAEFSTPFLMLWRYFGSDILGLVFVIAFFGCRIVYHGFFFMPQCVNLCIPIIGYGFSVPYMAMNVYFFYMIISKILRTATKTKKKKENTD